LVNSKTEAEIAAEVDKFCDVLGAYKAEVCLIHFAISCC